VNGHFPQIEKCFHFDEDRFDFWTVEEFLEGISATPEAVRYHNEAKNNDWFHWWILLSSSGICYFI
jgi:hypothetical protein